MRMPMAPSVRTLAVCCSIRGTPRNLRAERTDGRSRRRRSGPQRSGAGIQSTRHGDADHAGRDARLRRARARSGVEFRPVRTRLPRPSARAVMCAGQVPLPWTEALQSERRRIMKATQRHLPLALWLTFNDLLTKKAKTRRRVKSVWGRELRVRTSCKCRNRLRG
jgi:hypothetical protein